MRQRISANAVSAFVLALMLPGCTLPVTDMPIADRWLPVSITAKHIDPGIRRMGRLHFRGGLVLIADTKLFGGISGLEVLEDHRLVAVTDNAAWLEARIVLDNSGALIDITEARMTSMRDETAALFTSKKSGDAEALTQLPDGRFAVAFEQTQSIRIYDLDCAGPFSAAVKGPPLAEIEHLPGNNGLEALAADETGALIVGAEGRGGTTPLWRAPLEGTSPISPAAYYPLASGFSLTSLDRLPDGNFVALERFYAPLTGMRARITTFSADALKAGGVLNVTELARLASPVPVSNFEGIAAVRMNNDVTRLYIISDDNFSLFQRTLLYAFDWEQADKN